MIVRVHMVNGPLPAGRPDCDSHGAGATICFEGMVRPTENDRNIDALEYEVYEPMASKMLRRIGEEIARDFKLISICVEHSRGRVGVGQCSFRLRIAARHRKEGLAAMDAFIDRLKEDVPIWKSPVYSQA